MDGANPSFKDKNCEALFSANVEAALPERMRM
jgi:hypothetical protein